MNIDIHSHFLSRDCWDAIYRNGRHYAPTIVTAQNGDELMVFKGMNRGPIARQMWDPERRLKDMDAAGVDVQVLSAIPSLMYYDIEPEACLWFSRLQNDGIARIVKENPKRFVGVGSIPLQDSDIALSELDRAVNKLGLRGVEILGNVNGRPLDAPELFPFYKEMESLNLPILIHPEIAAGSAQMKKYFLSNLAGNPLDTTLAAAHLIFGGILERFPGLKFCLAHGGGYLPYQRGRWERGYLVRKECRVSISKPPSAYIPLLYFDIVTHYAPALEYLIETMGADKVLLGTDYPFDMAEDRPVDMVKGLTGISEADKQLILGGNAARIFSL